MGKTLILKPLLRSPNSISFMLIIFTFQLIQTIRILWFCHRSDLLVVILLQRCNRTFLNSVSAFPSWALRVPSNLSALRSQRCYGTYAPSASVAIAKRLASGTTSLLAGEPGRPRLVTPITLVPVNELGLGYSDGILDIHLEVDCDSNFSGAGYDGEPDSDVADMPIRLEVDSDSTDSDGGHDGELGSDIAVKRIPSDGEYAGKTYGYNGEPDSDVAETSIPSDGEYAGETDGDGTGGAEINIGVAVGTIGSASGTGLNIGTSVVGTNSIGLISFDRGDIWFRLPGIGKI
jgi:hypothetical protein